MKLFISGAEVYLSFYALAAAALLLLLDTSGMAALALAAVVLHELGHFAAIGVCGLRVRRVRVTLSGVIVASEGARTLGGRLFLLLSGCGANIAAALVCALLLHSARAYIFSAVNTVLALISLLPLSGSDGGEALRELASLRLGEANGARAAAAASVACSAGFVLLVAVLTLRRGAYLWGAVMLLLTAARLFAREVE